jgi:hypothetical protein
LVRQLDGLVEIAKGRLQKGIVVHRDPSLLLIGGLVQYEATIVVEGDGTVSQALDELPESMEAMDALSTDALGHLGILQGP